MCGSDKYYDKRYYRELKMSLFISDFQPYIIQIAATHSGSSFNSYVCPPLGVKIPECIPDLTGISRRGNNIYSKGEKAQSVNIKAALEQFISYLPQNTMLIGHNIHQFDNRILLHLKNNNLMDSFTSKVIGFMDTLPLAKEIYPDRKGKGGYSQEALVTDV